MRKTILALLATTAFAVSANATDLTGLPTKAVLTNPAYDWSGFYAGVNVGGAWGQNDSTLKTFLGDPTDTSLSSEAISGFIGGGQLGYNYQFSQFVVGLEGSGEWLGVSGQGPCLMALNCSDSATWEADLAARLGFAAGPLLIYAKGGVAWAHFSHTVALPGTFSTSASETPIGALVGAGIEYAVMQHLTARVEYDFIDFQDTTLNLFAGGQGIGGGQLNSVDYRKSLSLMKAGVNYKF